MQSYKYSCSFASPSILAGVTANTSEAHATHPASNALLSTKPLRSFQTSGDNSANRFISFDLSGVAGVTTSGIPGIFIDNCNVDTVKLYVSSSAAVTEGDWTLHSTVSINKDSRTGRRKAFIDLSAAPITRSYIRVLTQAGATLYAGSSGVTLNRVQIGSVVFVGPAMLKEVPGGKTPELKLSFNVPSVINEYGASVEVGQVGERTITFEIPSRSYLVDTQLDNALELLFSNGRPILFYENVAGMPQYAYMTVLPPSFNQINTEVVVGEVMAVSYAFREVI